MGRDCGELANEVAKRADADFLLVRELGLSEKDIVNETIDRIKHLQKIGQRDITIIGMENFVDLHNLSRRIKEQTDRDSRVCDHSYAQRGGDATTIEQEFARKFATLAMNCPRVSDADQLADIRFNPPKDGSAQAVGIRPIDNTISRLSIFTALDIKRGPYFPHIKQIPLPTEPKQSPIMLL